MTIATTGVTRVARLVSRALLTVVAGAAVGAGSAAAAATDPRDQEIRSDEVTATDQVVVDAGHLDLGPRFVDGEWQLQVRDDRAVPAVWRSLDDVVVHLTDAAVLPAPDGEDWRFLAVTAGEPLHVIPQTQAPEVPWIGWNTQDPEVTQRLGTGATLSLTGVTGPGALVLFLQEGVAAPPNVLWDSREPTPQPLFMETNTHVHANWVFTSTGPHRLALEVAADLGDGSRVVDEAVLRVAVGGEVDPTTLFATATDAADATGEGDAAIPEAAGDEARSVPAWLLAAGIGGLVVVVAAVAVASVAARRRRAAAWSRTSQDPA